MDHTLRTPAFVSELRVTLSSEFPLFIDEDAGAERGRCLPQGPTVQDDSPGVFAIRSVINTGRLFSLHFIC